MKEPTHVPSLSDCPSRGYAVARADRRPSADVSLHNADLHSDIHAAEYHGCRCVRTNNVAGGSRTTRLICC